jgi:hypothetical protein
VIAQVYVRLSSLTFGIQAQTVSGSKA